MNTENWLKTITVNDLGFSLCPRCKCYHLSLNYHILVCEDKTEEMICPSCGKLVIMQKELDEAKKEVARLSEIIEILSSDVDKDKLRDLSRYEGRN